MVKGEIYSFHGKFEFGNKVVGVFESIDNTTGFMVFKNIVSCEKINRNQNEFISYYNENKVPPEDFIRHPSGMYNINQTEAMYPMKNYWEEK